MTALQQQMHAAIAAAAREDRSATIRLLWEALKDHTPGARK